MSNQRYIRLPNGDTARVHAGNQIVAMLETDLNDMFEMAGDDLRGWLAEMATGDVDGLSEIKFRVIATSGACRLTIEVAGTLGDIEVEDLSEDDVRMQEFEVKVTRASYGTRTVRISARTIGEARDSANDDAGNHTYSEHHSEYVVEAQAVK